ncbi:MAG TPA: phosphohistidine phosphatase SixA [Longimicrobiaceae bacterium]|nr:phosphohistidine phosphatase SixA [Longimicrobiaceae bacterium]
MQLLVIRHGIAEDRTEFARTGQDDSFRPLTREGSRRMRRAARGLRRVVPRLGLLATSPLTRAVQTAEILADVYGGMELTEIPELAPDAHPSILLDRLRSLQVDPAEPVALVGHEPDLGRLASWLLSGQGRSFLPLKKGGACLLGFEELPEAGQAVLRWALAPGQLRRLRR